ncbi:hypothetical protein ASF43_27470 [Pseudorhodoferax sp. Leaf267]|nr:hypothetical protein ASF43_27470 [Pseudorhodoferax sp. Leaf267]
MLVVGHYFERMKWGGDDRWHIDFFPWRVLSLGTPFTIISAKTGAFLTKSMYCVIDDSELEPLEDDDDGLSRSTEKGKPVQKPREEATATGGAA